MSDFEEDNMKPKEIGFRMKVKQLFPDMIISNVKNLYTFYC
jgi:hypothetical protein